MLKKKEIAYFDDVHVIGYDFVQNNIFLYCLYVLMCFITLGIFYIISEWYPQIQFMYYIKVDAIRATHVMVRQDTEPTYSVIPLL